MHIRTALLWSAAIAAMGSGLVSTTACAQPYNQSASAAGDIAQWNALRGGGRQSFESYASFLVSHRDWPGVAALRRQAEAAIQPGVTGVGDVIRYFNALPPLTGPGMARFALALQANGRNPEAVTQARAAWARGDVGADDEARLLATFGSSLTPADHELRADALLCAGSTTAAARIIPMIAPNRRPILEARIAVQTRAPNGPALVAALGESGRRDPGLLYDQANAMNRGTNPGGARALMAQRRDLSRPPANPERFMDLMVTLARGAQNDGNLAQAFQIASQIDDIYPDGTDVSEKPYGERDEYTNLAWLAGNVALRGGRPADAIGMFERYGRASQSPQSRTKGIYWAGHAARAAGRQSQAEDYFRRAARNYDQFYGQLAADRLNQALPNPPAEQPAPSAQERAAFNNRSLVQAVRLLGQQGQYTNQSLFLRALADAVESDADRRMAADLGREINRRDLGVLVSRASRRSDAADIHGWGFPSVNVQPGYEMHWAAIHGITRQESLFDQQARSPVGASGLMQLMPGTAAQVARQSGQPYSAARLTSDPDYNVMLGSTYFSQLMDQWGSYPLAVASYNAGPGNVRRWIAANGDPRTGGIDMVEWIERIPFFETRNYVQRVLENAVVYELLNQPRSRRGQTGRLSHYLGRRPG